MSLTELPYESIQGLWQEVLAAIDFIDVHGELPLAREEFYRLRGKPVPADPFYDAYMNIFLEWFLIERPVNQGNSPLFTLLQRGTSFSAETVASLHYLLGSHHSLFEVMTPWKKDFFWLRDLIYGDDWLVSHWPPFPGIDPGQPMECRLVFFQDKVCLTPGIVVFPFSARDAVHSVIAECKKDMLLPDIMNLLSKMSIRSFRFSHLDPKRFFHLDDPMVKDLLHKQSTGDQ
ncbi:hypothetical protein KKF84_16585 [Myxococcota bacterium]|nr:hypothetical protein [Myxococcota bacterium]MBU1536942.1 hypothetical protein [Myxococcota bacterium]